MTYKEKILTEIERRWRELADKNVKVGGGKYDIEISTLLSIKNFIDSLSEEPVNENLEEAAEKCRWNIEEYCYQNDSGSYLYSEDDIEESFKAGAQWQKEQMQHNTEAAKRFIKDCTRTCSNETVSGLYESWLTPEQALRAVEIATGKQT